MDKNSDDKKHQVERLVRLFRTLLAKWYFNDDHSPKRCTHCGCKHFVTNPKEFINRRVAEEEHTCLRCNKVAGYWAYGSFDPCFVMGFIGAD